MGFINPTTRNPCFHFHFNLFTATTKHGIHGILEGVQVILDFLSHLLGAEGRSDSTKDSSSTAPLFN